jgi:hypothetical protein
VLNRPYAFQQWLATLDIEEDYIFMSEPDHLIIKPPPNWCDPYNVTTWGMQFDL